MTGDSSSPFAFYAFDQLYCVLKSDSGPKLSFDAIRQLFPSYAIEGKRTDEKTSLFITWKKRSGSSRDGVLRGCIGTFAKLPLLKGIEKYSLVAALQDHRFPPITEKELPKLTCSCNILHSFHAIFSDGKGDIFNWDLGTHGIELTFRDPSSNRIMSATFLPEVMPEQHWDKRDTFRNLIEKAGVWKDVDSLMNHYEDYFIEVIRYEGDKSQIGFDEFKRLRDGV
ncbi:LAFA_0E07888g1_1 [Lachancea sp. 'fantastica']|nr:LAFA_0E07888g1_1 [Lachancea sp. 'fantastica']